MKTIKLSGAAMEKAQQVISSHKRSAEKAEKLRQDLRAMEEHMQAAAHEGMQEIKKILGIETTLPCRMDPSYLEEHGDVFFILHEEEGDSDNFLSRVTGGKLN